MSYPPNQYPQNSNYNSPPGPPYPPQHPGAPYPVQQSNGMGTASLVCSIFGLFTCGLLSPISLLFGILGMRREPKGTALAGLLISLFGLLMLAGTILMTISTVRAAKTAYGEIQGAVMGEGSRMVVLEAARDIAQEWEDTEVLPAQQDGDDMIVKYKDLWGNAVIYDTDGDSYSTRSAGLDQKFGTEDDIVAGPFESVETALEETRGMAEIVKEEMEEAGIDPEDFKDLKDLEKLIDELPEQFPEGGSAPEDGDTDPRSESDSSDTDSNNNAEVDDEPADPIMPIEEDPVGGG